MAINREDLHRMIDKLPDEKLPRMADFFKWIFEEDDEELGPKELLEIENAEKRISKGEFIVLEELIEKYGSKDV